MIFAEILAGVTAFWAVVFVLVMLFLRGQDERK